MSVAGSIRGFAADDPDINVSVVGRLANGISPVLVTGREEGVVGAAAAAPEVAGIMMRVDKNPKITDYSLTGAVKTRLR